MRILLTNDDGVQSPGIRALREELSPGHEVWIVAPAADRSGASHSVTVFGAVRTRRLEERVYSCRGTPVDCVLVALHGLLPGPPDLVISGINLGANAGSDIIFSGTAAAARQAALFGVRAMAVSVHSFEPPFRFGAALAAVRKLLPALERAWDAEHFLNVNAPNVDDDDPELTLCGPARDRYENAISRFPAPSGEEYHFYRWGTKRETGDAGVDTTTLLAGKVAVSPVLIFPMLSPAVERYRRLLGGRPAE